LYATIVLVVVAGAAKAGPFEDAVAAYKVCDHATAYRLQRPLANQGFVKAQVNLGIMYAHGHGVSRDDVEAVRWFRKAADQGDRLAQHNLGVMYESGRGVPQNWSEAATLFRSAASTPKVVVYSKTMFARTFGSVWRQRRGTAELRIIAARSFRS
jgi:TPR repeat protein